GVDDEWDIIFTDVIVTDIGDMISLVRLRQEVAEKREIRIMNLKKVLFAGATSYLVNKRAKRRLYDLLDSEVDIDIAYDIFLRNTINRDQIAGFVFFPFVTSTSEFSQSSSVRHSTARADSIWDLFRKLIWIERDLEQQKPALTAMYQGLCEEERAFGVLWGAMAGRDYQTK